MLPVKHNPNSDQKPRHILMFPYPAQGHMIPLLDLAHQLALTNLTITVLVTPKNLPVLTPLLAAHPGHVTALVLPFPAHPRIPAGVENLRHIGNHGNVHVINALAGLRDPIAAWFWAHPDPPVAIVADLFLGWTASLARQLSIPAVAFSTSNAAYSVVIHDAWLRLRAAPGPPPPRFEFPDLPGSPSFRYDQMPSLFRISMERSAETDFVTESVLAGISATWRCVFNTFRDLEPDHLTHLREKLGSRGGTGRDRFYAVGPLNSLSAATRETGDARIAAWLDGCDDDSALYVCFGSQKVLSWQQAKALASGLERSGVRFVWAVKTDAAITVGKTGLVVEGWAPQVNILGHRAVGGFVSHCGWNSALEAISAGVKILAWPMEADQHMNARLLVEGIGVAVRVCEGADSMPDPDEVAGAIGRVMARDAPEKARAAEFRERAAAAVGPGGGSMSELDELVRELSELPKPVCEPK